MSDDNGTIVKSIDTAAAYTIQERANPPMVQEGSGGLLNWMGSIGEILPAWWSRSRDAKLRESWIKSPHMSGAIYTLSSKLASVPFRVEARDTSIDAHNRAAEYYQALLEEEAEFGQTWQEAFVLWLMDLWTQDNGAFMEVIGEGKKSGPIQGPVVGIAHLDSARCMRTNSIDYPVVYTDVNGIRFKLHRSRVIYRSQLPSPKVEMNRVGLCWVSRAFDVVQTMNDIIRYKQEKLGSRPQRAIMISKGGLSPKNIQDAFAKAAYAMDNQGLKRFSKYVVMGSQNMPDGSVEIIDLASLPDGFDEHENTTLGMYAIALTGAVPPRWLWPATVSGATRADAMFQHVAGLSGGPGVTLQMIATAIGGSERGSVASARGKVLPPYLRIVFDFQDDEQDRMQAEIRNTRAEASTKNIASGVTTLRVARERAVEDNDISSTQFTAMELEDGRLDNGDDVLTLFSSSDIFFQEVLDLGVDNPRLLHENDPIDMLIEIEMAISDVQYIMANVPQTSKLRLKSLQALGALGKLREMYSEMAVNERIMAEQEQQLQMQQDAELVTDVTDTASSASSTPSEGTDSSDGAVAATEAKPKPKPVPKPSVAAGGSADG